MGGERCQGYGSTDWKANQMLKDVDSGGCALEVLPVHIEQPVDKSGAASPSKLQNTLGLVGFGARGWRWETEDKTIKKK